MHFSRGRITTTKLLKLIYKRECQLVNLWECYFPRRYVCVQLFSFVWLFATLWIVAHQAPLSMRFFRQEYWSGLPFPPTGDLPDPGITPVSPVPPAFQGRFFTHSGTANILGGKHKENKFIYFHKENKGILQTLQSSAESPYGKYRTV